MKKGHLINSTDHINIFLMILSCLLSVYFPFELFLLSYAILGPLHYLTEIFWLRERNYFLQQKKDYRWLLIFIALITLTVTLPELEAVRTHPFFRRHGNSWNSSLFFVGFVCSIALSLLRNRRHQLILILAALLFAFFFYFSSFYILIFGLLLATLMHVSLFTFIFILQGAIKNKSRAAYVSLMVYIGCVIYILYGSLPAMGGMSDYTYNNYIKSNFNFVNTALAYYFTGANPAQHTMMSELGLRIQSFIAFSYTYHYLNWFSKADVIRWNRVSPGIKKITLLVWLLSLALYAWDYKLGLITLTFLSITHVFLEFPLNVLSIRSLFRK